MTPEGPNNFTGKLPDSLTRKDTFFEPVDWFALGLTSIIGLVIYLITLAPEVTLFMSGSLATASKYGGVAHPPGFPLWTLYAYAFTKLLPFSNIAWRVAVSSTTAGALTCGMIAGMVSSVGSKMLAGMAAFERLPPPSEKKLRVVCGAVAGLGFGFNGVFWNMAVTVETKPLCILLLFLEICLMTRWLYFPERLRFLYLAFLVFGLAASASQIVIPTALALPFFVLLGNPRLARELFLAATLLAAAVLFANHIGYFPMLNGPANLERAFYFWIAALTGAVSIGLIIKTKGILSEWRPALICGVLCIGGLALHITLPIASMTNPPMNWGYARTMEGFFHLLSRGQFEQLNPTGSPGDLLRQFWIYWLAAGEKFGWFYMISALVPFCFFHKLAARERKVLGGLLAFFFCLSVLMLFLLNPPPDRSALDLLSVYLCPSYLVLALWSGFGLIIAGTKLARSKKK